MGQQRRTYTDAFKAAVVDRHYDTGATQGNIAKERGIKGTQLKTWRLEIEAFGSAKATRRQKLGVAELERPRHKGGETMTNKRAFVTAHKSQYAVSTLCQRLTISRG